MRKILVFASLVLFSFSVNAQRTTFGIKGGLNLSTVKTDDDDFNKDRAMLPTFHVGPVLNIGVSENFSIQPQLLLQGKGVALAHEGHKDKFKFLSLDLPINLLFRSGGFFVGGGPNLGINLNGKYQSEDDPTENQDLEFGSEAGKIKRTNIGLNLMTGYQTQSGLVLNVNYLAGLSNWFNTSDKWRNNLFGIGVGYMFNR
jgi:hypothetical protein